MGNWTEAANELEDISPSAKSQAVVLKLRCGIYMAAEKWDGAIELARHLANRFPTQYRFPYLLACCYAQLGEFEDSKRWFQQAMRLNEKTAQKEAVTDDRLQPLWDCMSGTLWRRE